MNEISEQVDWETERQQPKLTLLTISQVAKTCSVSKRTVYRWIDKANLPTHFMPGIGTRRILRVSRDDLDRWLAQHRHDPAVKHASSTFALNGRRFIKSVQPQPQKPLDCRNHPASRVAVG